MEPIMRICCVTMPYLICKMKLGYNVMFSLAAMAEIMA